MNRLARRIVALIPVSYAAGVPVTVGLILHTKAPQPEWGMLLAPLFLGFLFVVLPILLGMLAWKAALWADLVPAFIRKRIS